MRALIKAQSLVMQQPLQAQRVLADRLGLSPATAAAHLQEHDFRVRLDQLLLSTMSQQLRWTGRGGQHNPLDWVDAAVLRALAPKAVNLP